MEIAEHMVALRLAGDRLAEAALAAGLDAEVPTCPGWRVRDLLAHIGGVHRWAAWHVRTGSPEEAGPEVVAGLFAAPDDDGLWEWYRRGHRALLDSLASAGPALRCWSFLPAPSALAFWARRQAHETAIHRVDAQCAGAGPEPFTPAFAADGIDELLSGFFSRPRGRLVSDPPVSLSVEPVDVATGWTVLIEPERRRVLPGCGPADLLLRGSASDLYLLLWNRGGLESVRVEGDRRVLDLWRERALVRW